MKTPFILRAVLLASLAVSTLSHAQQPVGQKPEPTPAEKAEELKQINAEIEKLGWTRQGMGKIGDKAQIIIPPGYRLTDGNGASKMLEFYGNPPSNSFLGMLSTENFEEHSILFQFKESGYVKDDEKDKLNADELLKGLQEGNEAGNERRRELGLDEMEITGWAVPPRYNEQTHNLESATKLKSKSSGSVTINHETHLLGRKGVMEVTLLCKPEELEGLLSSYQKILNGFSYIDGERYADFSIEKGDKMAEYGLTGLIAGGAIFAGAKMGIFAKFAAFFAKLGKVAYALIIGVLVGIKKLFGKLFGARTQE